MFLITRFLYFNKPFLESETKYEKSHTSEECGAHLRISSDMEYDRHNFLSFKAIFYSFAPLLTLKFKIWKKCKKHLETLSIYTCVP